MRLVPSALLVLSAAALALRAPSLGEEEFGNAPVVKQREWAAGILDVANDASRVYRRWINGNEDFCYGGGALELNRCLAAFGAVEAKQRLVRVLPTPGGTHSFEGQQVDFGWRLNVPSGIYLAMMTGEDEDSPWQYATLTVHFSAGEKPRLADLELPKSVTLIGPDELTARLIANVEDSEHQLRGYSLSLLREYTYLDPVVETLLTVLKSDDEHLQPTAAAGLAAAGRRGAGGVERIEELLDASQETGKLLPDDREDWRSKMFADALARLQAAESGPIDEDAEEAFAKHLEQLRAFVKDSAKQDR